MSTTDTLKGTEVIFVPLPIQFACPVPVTPQGETMRDGEPIPMGERTEFCAVMAHWMIGRQVSCDLHTLLACDLMGIDFDGLVRESGRDPVEARRPREKRTIGTQEEAQATGNASKK